MFLEREIDPLRGYGATWLRGYVATWLRGYVAKQLGNEEGFHTNKIESHWRQMKARLPTHCRKNEHYSSYLAEFKWRYNHSREDLWKAF